MHSKEQTSSTTFANPLTENKMQVNEMKYSLRGLRNKGIRTKPLKNRFASKLRITQ